MAIEVGPETVTKLEDTNPTPAVPSGKTMAERKAEVERIEREAAEKGVSPGSVASEVPSAPVTPQSDGQVPTDKDIAGSVKRFTDKEGKLAPPEVIQKENEHLEARIQRDKSKTEELLRKHRELRREFTQTSQERAKLEKELPKAVPSDDYDDPQKFKEGLETDAPTVLHKRISSVENRLRAEIQSMKAENQLEREAKELDVLVEEGHDWIDTEGLDRFKGVFAERPWLLQSKTPYSDALKFIPNLPALAQRRPVSTQTGKPLPILGGGSALPPPSSVPAASKELKMSELSEQIRVAMKRGDKSQVMALGEQLDKLERGY